MGFSIHSINTPRGAQTPNTPLVNLKTPLSGIIEILQALNEGRGVNAVCRVFGVSKSSLYRWQQRLSDLKPTLVLYALVRPAK